MNDATASTVEVSVTGESDRSPSEELKDQLVRELESRPHSVTVDLSRLEVIPSGILALLAAARRELAANDASLSVYVSPRAHQTLCEWRFDSVFVLHAKTPDADEKDQEVHPDGDSE